MSRLKIVAVYRGLAVDGRLPGGVAMAMYKLLQADPDNTVMLSFGGKQNNRILRQRLSASGVQTESITELDPHLAAGGYAEANELFWPWAHDQTHYAPAVSRGVWSTRFGHFLDMNRAMAEAVLATAGGRPFNLMVNDYQLTRVSRQVHKRASVAGIPHGIAHFAHTPWGNDLTVPDMDYLDRFALGISSADVVGFHTRAWVDTYLKHVETRLSARYQVDRTGTVPVLRRGHNGRLTRVIVQPIGIDHELWLTHASGPIVMDWLPKTPFFVSVERCDHTKEIATRFRAIRRYFEKYPERRGQITFLQICEATRVGVPHFNAYFEECEREEARANELAIGDWKPLVWFKGNVAPVNLGPIYRRARGIIVNSYKDGFCMVYPEGIVCTDPVNPGVGFLSRGCGCFSILGDGAVELDPGNTEGMADAFERGFTMPLDERRRRADWSRQQIVRNPLATWAKRFFSELN